MKHYYYFFISSLPMLHFGAKPLISYAHFLDECRRNLAVHDMEIIERAGVLLSEAGGDDFVMLEEWKRFETSLRNELARLRALKKNKDASAYIRGDNFQDPFTGHFAHLAVSQENILEGERHLDKIRWDKIDELARHHYFDIEFLVMYALKLQILERWHRFNEADGMKFLQEAIGERG